MVYRELILAIVFCRYSLGRERIGGGMPSRTSCRETPSCQRPMRPHTSLGVEVQRPMCNRRLCLRPGPARKRSRFNCSSSTAHGLIPADLTGFKLIQWDLSGKIVGELQRKHGDDYLGKEWDLYAEVGAALRIVLALARKHVPNKNRGAFLQAPAAWNVISPPHKIAVVPSYDPADLARGHERFLKVLQAYTDESEGEEEEEYRPYMLVNWLPLPCSRSEITQRGLYQAR
jgi:hypothetical protein